MPLPLTRTLLLLLSLLSLFFLLTYISLTSLSNPTSSAHNRQSATNFLFPSTAIISLTDDNSTCFLSRPAAFGPSLPKSGLKGELFVLEEGQLACDDAPGWDPSALSLSSLPSGEEDGTDDMHYVSSIAHPEESKSQHADIESLQQSAEIEGKIVLVTRGGCGFLEKVLWAQRRGAVALIVGDYKRTGAIGSGGLVTMYAKGSALGDTSNITIPSIFTTHTTARLLTSLLPRYLSSVPSRHTIAPPAPPPAPPVKEDGHKLKIKWLFSSGGNPEPKESGFNVPVPTTTKTAKTAKTSTKISTATSTPTMVVGTLPEWKGVQVDSSHRPPMSGELEGIVFVVKSDEMKKDDDVAGDGGREGLWITLTPTSMSNSPFFDTLLVLVVSPLVTLTVVYALLLVRSMVRRRRWRAPKSVVDRLPVRTYQSTSTTTATAYPSLPNPPSPRRTPPPAPPPAPHPPRSSSLPAPSSGESRARSPEARTKDVTEGSKEEVPRRSRYMGGAVECVVCLEEYVDGVSRVMKLPCGHEFHASCITPWLTTRRRTCPICKGDVVRGTAAGSSSGSGWVRHADAGEVSERTPLVGDEEGED